MFVTDRCSFNKKRFITAHLVLKGVDSFFLKIFYGFETVYNPKSTDDLVFHVKGSVSTKVEICDIFSRALESEEIDNLQFHQFKTPAETTRRLRNRVKTEKTFGISTSVKCDADLKQKKFTFQTIDNQLMAMGNVFTCAESFVAMMINLIDSSKLPVDKVVEIRKDELWAYLETIEIPGLDPEINFMTVSKHGQPHRVFQLYPETIDNLLSSLQQVKEKVALYRIRK